MPSQTALGTFWRLIAQTVALTSGVFSLGLTIYLLVRAAADVPVSPRATLSIVVYLAAIAFILSAGICWFYEHSRVKELEQVLHASTASLEARYDPDADPPHYEVPRHFDEIDCRLGVYNAGPAVARNVVVRVMRVLYGSNVTFIDGFPFPCERVDAPGDRSINAGEEAIYPILELRDIVKKSGLEGQRKMGYRFFWQPQWKEGSLIVGVGGNVTVTLQITVENAKAVDCTIVFHGEADRMVGRLSSQI